MKAGIVRTDLGPGIYTSDVESRVQRDFSSEPAGQSRSLRRPTDTELTTTLNTYALLSVRGTDMAATVSTVGANVLRIRVLAANPFVVITVTSGGAVAKTLIRDQLNAGFRDNALPFLAVIVGTNQIQINTSSPNTGPTARLEIDSTANGSTLNTSVGFGAGGTTLTGLSVASLKTAVYPTAVTINVASATISALSTFSLLSTTQLTALVNAIVERVAPHFVETSAVMLSFAYGAFAKMRSAAFQPGGARAGLPAGIGAAFLADDGVTPYSV